MNTFKDYKELVVLSLDVLPATENELKKRDFIKRVAVEHIDRMLMDLENNNHIYTKGNKYYAYKKSSFLINKEH
ncbi:hypothetical protein [Poseidonibacter ostreae]|uniref:Uncharacterized protein n=1 Tax=Poseidonibacter ostreae TaxID=2654171 RepID=A0A6L4WX84_9BACT|nr:hypothetical protein [Poseidonibacter ostreae]KAB7891363.1 hypothetical protein GBG19_00575 [Poseidonibacter ostreae]